MRVSVDGDLCSGCGVCESICPEVFEMNDEGKASVKADPVPAAAEDSCKEALDGCPSGALQEVK